MPSDLHHNGAVIRYDAQLLPQMEPRLFEAQWLRDANHWQGSSGGRNQAHFFHFAGRDMVLRHFHRGGLVGRVNADRYLRLGAGQSRSLREFDLLAEMRAAGLPVPRPVAAQYAPSGPFYRADIITERIAGARPLQEVLAERALSPALWGAIGAVVRRLHDHGVFHSDLNCRNILLDEGGQAWLIDFDKCDKRAPGGWSAANLARLKRSLVKSAGQMLLNWHEGDWRDFLAGYEAGEG